LPYPRWLQVLSHESLLVYAGHICILYRIALNGRSLGATYSKQLGIVECLVLMTFLIGVMWVAAKLWAGLKKRNRALARGIAFASVPFVAVVLG
jgi:surface polysaccharide O-acyltransferase-like enzyme